MPRKVHFGDAEKIGTMFRRNAKSRMLEAAQALEHAIETGRGGF